MPRTDSPEYKLGLRYINDGPLSIRDLSEMLSISRRNANEYVKLWRSQGKPIRIVDWRHYTIENGGKGGDMAPVYGISEYPGQPDEPKPKAIKAAERQRLCRLRRRATDQVKRRAKNGTTNDYAQLLLK